MCPTTASLCASQFLLVNRMKLFQHSRRGAQNRLQQHLLPPGLGMSRVRKNASHKMNPDATGNCMASTALAANGTKQSVGIKFKTGQDRAWKKCGKSDVPKWYHGSHKIHRTTPLFIIMATNCKQSLLHRTINIRSIIMVNVTEL